MNCIKYRGRTYRPEVLFNKIRNNPEFYIKRHKIQLSDIKEVISRSSEDTLLYSLFQPSDFDQNGNVKPEVLAEIQAEKENIISEAKANGTFMKAPNGKPTNLNEEQWVAVRTQRFKDWFGDWEKDPENSSKVVDENGEPKVVAHSTDKTFHEFINTQENDAGWLGKGYYFFGDRSLDGQYGKNVMEVFLNSKEPYYISNEEQSDLVEADDKEYSAEFSENIQSEGYDAIYYNGDLNQEWNVFHPNQIKSAMDNVGTYSEDSNDIRYQIIGEKGAEQLDKSQEVTHRMDNLSVAREMENANKTPKEIRLATGWERGADGKWRYEILDGELSTTEETASAKLGDLFDSKELYEAYPKLRDIEVEISIGVKNENKGAFYHKPKKIEIHATDKQSAKSILTHEIQHAIQKIEGFARGGDVESMPDNITQEQVRADYHYKRYQELFDKAPKELQERLRERNRAEIEKDFEKVEAIESELFESEYADIFKEIDGADWEFRINKLSDYSTRLQKRDVYTQLQGEVEARNAQKRMNMTAEERREKLLSETEDVAREDQIFSVSNEKSLSENSQNKNNIQFQVAGSNLFNPPTNSSRRNATLSDNGVPTDPQQKRKNIVRFVKNTFQSDRGLQREVANAVRSLGFERSALTSVLEYDAQVLKKILQKYTKGITKQEANQRLKAINQYLQGDKNAADFLSDDDKNSIEVLRMRIDENSGRIIQTLNDKIQRLNDKLNDPNLPKVSRANIQQAIKNTQNLIQIIEQNKGNYMKRSYQAFHDPNYLNALLAENDDASKQLIDNAVQYLMNNSANLFGSTLTQQQARSKVFEYIDNLRHKSTDFAPPFATGGINAPFFKKRNDQLPKVFRELLGEIHDPLTNYINTMHSTANYLAAVTYQTKLSEVLMDSGIGSYQAEKGMTRLSSKGERWELLQGIYVPTEIKEAIEDLQPLDPVTGFAKLWVNLSAWTKVMKTVYSPTTMMRNIWSGFVLALNAGFDVFSPKTIYALKIAWGAGMSRAEIRLEREKLFRSGVIGDGAVSGEILQLMNDYQKANHSQKKGFTEKSLELAQKMYAIGDDFFRTAGFYIFKERYMRAGLSESQAEQKAAQRISDTYPTYSRLPRNIRHLRRFPLSGTFVSFPYESIRTTANTLKYIAEDIHEAKKTGNKQRWSMAMKGIAGVVMATALPIAFKAISKALTGITDEEEEAILETLPDYQTNANLLFLGSENGMPVFMDMTAFFPSEVWVKPLRVLVENRESRDTWDKLSHSAKELLTPYYSEDIMTKTLRELIINNQNQYGQAIYKGNNIFQGIWNSPKEVAQHFLKQAGPGVYNNFAEFMKANEIAPEIFGEKHTHYGKEYTNKEAVLGLLGFRLTTLNMAVSLKYTSQQLKREVSDEHSKINRQVIYQRELSDDDLQDMVSEKTTSHRQYYDKLFLSVACAKRFEMKDEDIKSILKGSGYSNTDSNRVIRAVYPEINEISNQTIRKKKKEIQMTYAHDKAKAQQFTATYLKNMERYNRLIRKENQKMNNR